MRVAFLTVGSFVDWVPFGSPVDLRSDVTAALRREGWTVEIADFAERRNPLSTTVTFDGVVQFETQSTDVNAVRNRLTDIMHGVTGKPTVVTPTGLGTPRQTPSDMPWQLTAAMLVVGLVALAVIFVKVKP